MTYKTRWSTQFSWALGLFLAGYVVTAAGSAFAQGDPGIVENPPSPSPLDIVEPTILPPVGQGIPVPAYSSRPGAAYTHYLNFGGFTFNGLWGGQASQNPGTTPAYTVDGDATTFNATELANIKNIWSRVAEKFAPFNINVTTVDPAPAGTDASKQLYYDNTARLMHTVIGGSGGWTGGGGVSYVGVTRFSYTGTGTSNGYHTNWAFSGQAPSNLQFVAEVTAHEDGHGLNLSHQSVYSGTTLINEYNPGTGVGVGSKAPIMGNSYSAARGLWRIGDAHDVYTGGKITQNDLAFMMSSNGGLSPFINDGIGHTLGTATPMPMNGLSIDFNTATGVIVPISSSPTVTGGSANFTSDYWSFTTGTGMVSLQVIAGRQSITPGFADPGAMLDASLEIYTTGGLPLFSATTTSLSETLTVPLVAGTYIARVFSAGDPLALGYYDIGSYFLKGTVAPEPSMVALVLMSASWLVFSWRKRHG
jgi:hypothetical protein